MPMKTSRFVQDILIDAVKKMQDDGSLYLSGVVMASGVEVLGAILGTAPPSSTPVSRERMSEQRFNDAITSLFPASYHRLQARTPGLYAGWRCWGVHQLAPGGYGFLGAQEARAKGIAHLSERGGVVVLVCEELYADYANACRKVLARLLTGLLPDADFLWVPGDSVLPTSTGAAGSGGIADCSGVPPGSR